jgi:hypothetical protein
VVKTDNYYNLKFAEPDKDKRLSQQKKNSEIKLEIFNSNTILGNINDILTVFYK